MRYVFSGSVSTKSLSLYDRSDRTVEVTRCEAAERQAQPPTRVCGGKTYGIRMYFWRL